jgi:hypothetical protein
MNKKGYLIVTVICGLTLLAAIGTGVYDLFNGTDNPPGEVTAETETVSEVDSDTTDTVWNDETVSESEDTEADTIPAIKEDPKLPDVQGKPVIDVEEMTRNPNAEVVDSKIEYGTKEADTHEE